MIQKIDRYKLVLLREKQDGEIVVKLPTIEASYIGQNGVPELIPEEEKEGIILHKLYESIVHQIEMERI